MLASLHTSRHEPLRVSDHCHTLSHTVTHGHTRPHRRPPWIDASSISRGVDRVLSLVDRSRTSLATRVSHVAQVPRAVRANRELCPVIAVPAGDKFDAFFGRPLQIQVKGSRHRRVLSENDQVRQVGHGFELGDACEVMLPVSEMTLDLGKVTRVCDSSDDSRDSGMAMGRHHSGRPTGSGGSGGGGTTTMDVRLWDGTTRLRLASGTLVAALGPTDVVTSIASGEQGRVLRETHDGAYLVRFVGGDESTVPHDGLIKHYSVGARVRCRGVQCEISAVKIHAQTGTPMRYAPTLVVGVSQHSSE